MKVICINDADQYDIENIHPKVKRGHIYTVVEVNYEKEERVIEKNLYIKYVEGEYYQLAETGDETQYHSSLFLKIEEDQKDETEMVRESLMEKA